MEKAKPLQLNPPTFPRLPLRLLLGLAVGLLLACGRAAPEQALRTQIQDMQTAAGEGRVGDFMDGVTKDFAGNNGMDRAALHNMLRMQVLGNAKVGVTTGPLEVEVQGERATVRFSALLTGGGGRFVPDNAQAIAITSGWRVEESEWRVYYAQWEPKL